MKWIATKDISPPKDCKILAYFKFCGAMRINMIKWQERNKTWITDMQHNRINEPLLWMHLPKLP